MRWCFVLLFGFAVVLASHSSSYASSSVVCDGTDKTDSLQTALNTGGLIYLTLGGSGSTLGVCYVSHTLTMSQDSTVLVGQGGGFYGVVNPETAKTILRWDTTTAPPPTPSFSPFPTPTVSPTLPPAPSVSPTYGTTLLQIGTSTTTVHGGGIYNIAFSSNGGKLAYGLWLNGSSGLSFQNLSFDAFRKVSILVGGPVNDNVNNYFQTIALDNEISGNPGNSGTALMLGYPGATNAHFNEFHDLSITTTTGYGIYVANSNVSWFYNVQESKTAHTRYGPQWGVVFGCGSTGTKMEWLSAISYQMPDPNTSLANSVYVAGRNDCATDEEARVDGISMYDEHVQGGASPTIGQGGPFHWLCTNDAHLGC